MIPTVQYHCLKLYTRTFLPVIFNKHGLHNLGFNNHTNMNVCT